MLYNELCPLWVISSLDDDSAKEFANKLERQLMAFSKNEFGSVFNPEQDKWWRIDNISKVADIQIDSLGHPKDIPVYQKEGDNVNISGLTIVLYSENENFATCIDVVNELKKKRDADEFMLGEGNQVRYYGLLSFTKGQKINEKLKILLDNQVTKPKKSRRKTGHNLITEIENLQLDKFPFDSILLQGNCNRVRQNRFCYDKLVGDDGKRNDIDLSVQIIYHLALTHDVLSYVDQKRLNVVGAFSLNYEPEKERHSYAVDLTNTIVNKFSKDDTGEHWYKEKDADISKQFKLEQGWKSIYDKLKKGYQNLDTSDLIPKSSVSPWKLFLKILIPYYFKKFIRGLVRHVKDNVDGFSFVTLQNYQNHIDNQYERMVRDEEQRKHIEDELSDIWNNENMYNCTIGMQQFLSRLTLMSNYFEEQRDIIKGLWEKKTADGKHNGFPELSDYPLGNFGIYHKNYCKYIHTDFVVSDSIDKNKDLRGEGMLQKTIRLLAFHPVPLSLFVRSVLLGILLPMIILTTLLLIPDYIFNTAYLESVPGSYILCGVCFITCVVWALFKYGLSVVSSIKNNLYNYVGWSLCRLQLTAYRLTLKKGIDYFERCISICDDIKTRGKAFVDENIILEKDNNVGFEENMFQANVMRSFEEERILKKGVIIPKIMTAFNQYGKLVEQLEKILPERDESIENLHYGILRKNLIVNDNGVKNQLKKILFGHNSDTDFTIITIDIKSEKQEFCKMLSKAICKGIVFYINNRQIQTISDIVLDTMGKCNFNGWEKSNDGLTIISNPIGDMINARSDPSANVDEAFPYASIFVPDSAHEWRENLYLEEDEDNRYNTLKGNNECSILQGYAIARINMINDLKN